MTPQSQTQAPTPQHHDEQILVVKRSHLFPTTESAWLGINATDLSNYVNIICKHQEFQPRSAMELDPAYKQIIPYMVFQHGDRYFLMQRRSTASEKRLQNLYSLGIGGHVRKEDLVGTNLMKWAEREFHEEINYTGTFTVTPLGILNDDSNEVGRVHLGLVLLLKGDLDTISIRSELKSGQLLTLNECHEYYAQLESWSKLVLGFLEHNKNVL